MTDVPTLVPGGLQVDSEAGLRTDDFGLGGDMQKQLVDALTARWPDADADPDAADAGVAPGQPADTAATPVPAPDISPAAPQSDESGAGDGSAADAADGGAAAPATDAAAPVPAPTDFDLNEFARDYFGTNLTREQSAELFGVLNGLQRLTPQQRADLDRVLASGGTPAYQPTQYPVTGQPPAYPPGPPPPPPDPLTDYAVNVLGPRPADDDYAARMWDLSAAGVRAQQQQLDTIQQTIAEQTARDLQRERTLASERIEAAQSSWRESHSILTDGEYDGLVSRAVASGQFPAVLAAHHGDYTSAVNTLFDQHFWADQRLRDKAIANIASGRSPMDAAPDPASPIAQDQAALEAGRAQLAASVAGGGGNISAPPGTPPSTPTDPKDKRAAMLAAIASQHDFTA